MKTFEEICTLPETVPVPRCAQCGEACKPGITFIGKMLPEAAFEGAVALARQADLMLVLGSAQPRPP